MTPSVSELEALRADVQELTMTVANLKKRRARGFAFASLAVISLIAVQSFQSVARDTNVEAPFTIVDSRGAPIFAVDNDHTIRIMNEGGQQRVTFSNLSDGPLIALQGKDGITAIASDNFEIIAKHTGDDASLGFATGTKTLALRFSRGGKTTAAVGVGANGLGVLTVKDQEGRQAVTISSVGSAGFVDVFSGGATVAELSSTDDGKGKIAVYNKGGKPVAYLTEASQGGGGNITIADPAGNGIVSAGYSPSDEGDICLDRKQHLYCVGVNLPLSLSH